MSPDAMREACDAIVQRMQEARETFRQGRLSFEKRMREMHRRRPRPPKRKGGGSEPVTVEPNRPKLGEGGAAVALEFDE
jgi:hypothetical protein